MNTPKVVFENPGVMDIRALCTFGINSKPQSLNPIGYFGTGLKYAIAVLARTEHQTTIYCGKKAYKVKVENGMFRGKPLQFIYLTGLGHNIEMPYTTELGKGWELWQVFRELFANTLDEGGTCYLSESPIRGIEGMTRIVVEGSKFVETYHNRQEIFLVEQKPEKICENLDLEVYKGPSKVVYYRGVKALELKKPSVHTYNILTSSELTEDRTLKYSYLVDLLITRFIAQSTNSEFVASSIRASNETYEGSLNFGDLGEFRKPSTVFADAVKIAQREKACDNQTIFSYVAKHLDAGTRSKSKGKFTIQLIRLLQAENWDSAMGLIKDNKDEVIKALYQYDDSDNSDVTIPF